jgi:dolichol-phosphate mannosyltransferase
MALVSIVIPVYYNSPSLGALAGRLRQLSADNVRHEFEFLFVDDGSGDDSFPVLQQLAEQDTRIRVIKLSRNYGSTTAVMAGITYARGDCVAFIAADLQDPPESLSEMILEWESGFKVVLAVRKDRQGDPWATRVCANFFNWIYEKLVFQGYSPQGVGFFLIDRKVADFVVTSGEKNAYLPGLILWAGFHPKMVTYDREKRLHGKSRWTFQKKVKYLIDAFAAFSYLPLRLSSLFGIALASLGALYALTIIILRLLNLIPVPGWSALTTIVLITSGTQLVMLGIIGEYLWRTLDASRTRPLFVVESTINIPAPSFAIDPRSNGQRTSAVTEGISFESLVH